MSNNDVTFARELNINGEIYNLSTGEGNVERFYVKTPALAMPAF